MRITIALLAAATLAMPALAAEPGYEQWQVKVQTADLDLSSATGQRALDKRLSQAVTRLCGYPVTFTRDELMNRLRGIDAELFSRAVDTLVSRLRHKLKDTSKTPRFIKTVWGRGYTFVGEPG